MFFWTDLSVWLSFYCIWFSLCNFCEDDGSLRRSNHSGESIKTGVSRKLRSQGVYFLSNVLVSGPDKLLTELRYGYFSRIFQIKSKVNYTLCHFNCLVYRAASAQAANIKEHLYTNFTSTLFQESTLKSHQALAGYLLRCAILMLVSEMIKTNLLCLSLTDFSKCPGS